MCIDTIMMFWLNVHMILESQNKQCNVMQNLFHYFNAILEYYFHGPGRTYVRHLLHPRAIENLLPWMMRGGCWSSVTWHKPAVLFRFSSFLPEIARVAPCFESMMAVAAPMPELAPVTRATFPLSLDMTNLEAPDDASLTD